MPDRPEISRYPVTVESPAPGTGGSPAVLEFERSFVRLRSGSVELDRSPVSAAAVERIDSDTFTLTLGSKWVIRPENVVEFLFDAAPVLGRTSRWRHLPRHRRVPPLVLHLALTSAILLVGLIMGRFQFDGSERLTWLVAGLMLFVGILWSRLWNLEQGVGHTSETSAVHVESRATVEVRRTVSGNIDLMRELLGERLGTPEPPPAPEMVSGWLPPITIVTHGSRSIHLLPAGPLPTHRN